MYLIKWLENAHQMSRIFYVQLKAFHLKNSTAACLSRNNVPVSLSNAQTSLSTVFIEQLLWKKIVPLTTRSVDYPAKDRNESCCWVFQMSFLEALSTTDETPFKSIVFGTQQKTHRPSRCTESESDCAWRDINAAEWKNMCFELSERTL